jgi:hypothetical protein
MLLEPLAGIPVTQRQAYQFRKVDDRQMVLFPRLPGNLLLPGVQV